MPSIKIDNDKNSNRSTLLIKLKSNLWKCYQIRKKHYCLTIFIILLPVLSFALLGYARAKIGELQTIIVDKPTYNPIWTEDDLYETFKLDIESSVILYTPATNFTNTLMRRVQLKLDLLNHGIESFPSEEDLLHHYFAAQQKVCFAVIFHGLENDSIPTHLDYDIRFNDNNIRWKPNDLFQDDGEYKQGTGSENYFQSGFILLQMAIDTNYINIQNQFNLTLTMQEFPYPPYTEHSEVAVSLFGILPAVTLLSFILVCPTTLKNIVEEKDSGIKELMKMMGLPTFVMWICWFIEALLLNTVSIIMIVLCMKIDFGANAGALQYCDPLIFGIFLLLYCSASTAFCFLISTIINNPNFTTVIGIAIWIITHFVASSLRELLNVIPFEVQLLSCIFPNFAMNFGYRIISGYEYRDIGLQWVNFGKPAAEGINELAMMHIFVMLIVDIFVCMLFAIYIDSINPGKMGAGKPYYYPLTIIKNTIFTNFEKDLPIFIRVIDESNSKIEECNSRTCVRIQKVCKVYEKSVLHNFSIKFYEGEITALLGHNGAGKTTILSIISGMVPATSGTVEIAGHSLIDRLDYIRSMVGICPQHNLLFNDLSVINHLKFVGMLNGIEDYERKISVLLSTLKLNEQRHLTPNKLSGGMKRKLCLGMALIKNPKVLILDEPTSGLDTESRREIWNILNDLKNDVDFKTCSIIISTHYMDEAEQLGDRIAIVDHGTCMAYGTPQFLKREYGTGTNLTIVKERPSDEFYVKIHEVIGKHYTQKIEYTKKQNSITYRLDQDTNKLLKVVQDLENLKMKGLIDDIMITNTSVDDVLTCISGSKQDTWLQEKQCDTKESDTNTAFQRSSSNFSGSDHSKRYMGFRNIGCILFKTHCQFIKKLKGTYLLSALFCIMVTVILLIVTTPSYIHYAANNNSLKVDLNWYGNTNVYCSASNTSENQQLLQQFKTISRAKLGQVVVVDSVSEALINEGINNIEKYNQHAVVAAEFNSTGDEDIVNAMYSNLALHGAPISWNLIANTIVATYLGQEFSIKTQNKPLPIPNKENLTKKSELKIAFLWMTCFPLGLLFFTGSFIIYPHVQKKSNLFQLLHMAGVKKSVYWAELFMLDYTLYSIICVLILLIIKISNNPIFSGLKEISTISIILFLYGVSTIPIMYLFSLLKSLPAAMTYLQMYSLIGGIILSLVIQLLEYSGDYMYESIAHTLRYFFQLVPHYLLTYVMFNFCRKAVWNYNWSILDEDAKNIKCKFAPNPCCDKNNTVACAHFQSYSNLVTVNSHQITTGLPILMLLVALIMVLLMFLQSFRKICSDKSKPNCETFFTVKNLTKSFNKKTAVKDLDFKVGKGECFGLLGVNGSGKTTAFKLLTGAIITGNGDAGIENCWLSKEEMKYLSKIGYCPQVDALNEALTVKEMLLLFGNIRGYVDVEKIVDNLIYELGLSEYSDVLCGECSGGNKRKLSLGISLIVDPDVIMLDEPTCGVDPISRRYLWNYLAKLKVTTEKAMVLTSHSLAECEVLCDSVSILSKGCVLEEQTPVSQLKKNYGKIYTVEIKVNNKTDCAVEEVENKFLNDFRSEQARLQSKHLYLLKFSVNGETSMIQLLQKLEDFRKLHNDIEDYVISMPNLEEIFLHIIKIKCFSHNILINS